MAYTVSRIAGLIYGQHPRDIVFLECPEDPRVNAKIVFDKLDTKHKQEMLNKFDLWQRAELHVTRYFHGFDEIGFKECFVFKRKHAGTYHRFYGFLTHPCPSSRPRYQVCVLVSHAIKNRENTDPSELNFVNVVRVTPELISALKREFPEERRIGGRRDTLDIRKR
jgi:hypothetical protein